MLYVLDIFFGEGMYIGYSEMRLLLISFLYIVALFKCKIRITTLTVIL